jgi:hypothetical protein
MGPDAERPLDLGHQHGLIVVVGPGGDDPADALAIGAEERKSDNGTFGLARRRLAAVLGGSRRRGGKSHHDSGKRGENVAHGNDRNWHCGS